MALKATAWRGVLIAQFEEYFDDALIWVVLLQILTVFLSDTV